VVAVRVAHFHIRNNFTAHPLTVFVCCVLLIQSVAVISLHRVKTIAHVMEVIRVRCDVRTEFLRLGSFMWKPAKGRAIGQLDSCRILTAEAGILSQSRACEIHGGQKSRETRFSASSSLFVCHYHSAYALYSFLSTCCSCQGDKRAKPGNFYKRNVLSQIWDHSIEN